MQLHVLGVGGPRPSSDGKRFGTSLVLETGGEKIMIDCGPGTTYKMGLIGLSPVQINSLFITHHHFDHVIDLPCFSLVRFDLDPGDLPDLHVYGPAPTAQLVDDLVGQGGVFRPDIIARREHPVSIHGFHERGGSGSRPDVKTIAKDLESRSVVRGSSWQASALRVPHIEPYHISLAYRFDTDEGSIAFMCDSAPGPEFAAFADGVDTLVTGILGFNTRTERYAPLHEVSADIPDVVDVANQAGIPRIIGIHGSPLGTLGQQALRNGYDANTYSGIVMCPNELETIALDRLAIG